MSKSKKTNYLSDVKLPKKGEIVKGVVVGVDKYAVYVDLPGMKTGIIWAGNLKNIGKTVRDFKLGEEATATIKNTDNEDGFLELEIKDEIKESRWSYFRDIMAKGEMIEEKVSGVNRGGLIIESKGIKGFLPVSQLSREKYPKVEGGDREKILEELKKFIGQTFKIKVIGVDMKNDKLFFSEKGLDNEEAKKIVGQFKVGDVVGGIISNIVDFGIFINIVSADGGILPIEGLIHISELDWQLVENPKEFLRVGDKVQAKIISIEGDRISLSIKQLKDNPWEIAAKKYKKGDVVSGVAVKYNPFGVFVRIDNLVQALCHISEFGSEKAMKETIQIGQEYKFTINLFDPASYKIGLKLIKEGEPQESQPIEEKKEEETKEAF